MQPNPAIANYSFNVVSNGDTHEFTYRKAKYNAAMILPMIFLAALISIILALLFHFYVAGWVISTLLLSVGIYFLMNLRTRTAHSFIITGTQFIINGQSYDRGHIHETYYKAPNMPEQTVVIMNRRGFGAAGQQLSEDAKNQLRKHYYNANFQVGFLYGERRVTIASGLQEDSALVLFRKINELTGFNQFA